MTLRLFLLLEFLTENAEIAGRSGEHDSLLFRMRSLV